MGIFRSFAISASALSAERLRMDVIANNLANAQTTRGADGEPFRRKMVVFQEREAELVRRRGPDGSGGRDSAAFRGVGVRVAGIVEDPSPLRLVYDPGHPDADADGMVAYPNVNTVTEMVDLISASRAYEANVTALDAAKQMALRALEIGRR